MTKTTALLLLVALVFSAFANAQPPPRIPPPPPPPPDLVIRDVGADIGLLAAAASRIGALGLMTVGRELTKDEQAQIDDAHQVAELLGAGGRNFLGPISKLAQERGIFQESIRALQHGEYQQAGVGLVHCLVLFPDAKILWRELAEVWLRLEDAESAAGCLAAAVGYIPREDEVFVALIKMSLVNWEFEEAKIPEKGPDMPQPRASIATLSRARAALSLAWSRELADEVQLGIEKRLEGDNKSPELAAAVVVELSLAAAKALMEGDDFPGRSEAVEGLHLAAIGACDGNWASFLRLLALARELPITEHREQARKLIDVAVAVAYLVLYPDHELPPEVREAAENMTDFPVLQAFLAYLGE